MSTHSISSCSKRGFTLVELLMVVAIIATIAVLATIKVGQTLRNAQDTLTLRDLITIRDAFQQLVLDCDGTKFFCKASPIADYHYEEALDLRLHNLFSHTNFLGNSGITDEILKANYNGFGLFNNRSAWKGPYLQPSLAKFDEITHEYRYFDRNGFPYVLQLPSCTNTYFNSELAGAIPTSFSHAWENRRWEYARVICVGGNGKLDTPNDRLAGIQRVGGVLTTNRGDDVVLFLNRADGWEDPDAF